MLSCDHNDTCSSDYDEAMKLFSQARSAYASGMPDSALNSFVRVGVMLATSDSVSHRNLSAEAYNTAGVIYFLQGNYPESVNSFLTAEQIGNDSIKARVYNNIASIFHYFNDNERAIEYLDMAAEGGLRTGEWDVLRSSTLNILNYCFEVDDKGKAVSAMERLLGARLPDDNWSRYVVRTGLGMRAAVGDSIPEAIGYFNEAIALADSLKNSDRYRMISYNHLARTLMLAGKYEQAIECLDTVSVLCGGSKQADTYMALCELKADCYWATGQPVREYEERLKYVELKDSQFSAKEFGKILELQSAQKINRVENNLAAEKELRLSRERLAWILGLVVLVLSAAGVWIWMQNKRLREAMEVLYRKTHDHDSGETEFDGQISSENKDCEEESVEDSSNQPIADEQAEKIFRMIEKVMNEKRPFLHPSFSVRDLADLVGSNTKYVSYAINRCLGKSFPSMVNGYRVGEACRRLREEAGERTYTIESIATECGFKSRTNFSTIFKKSTGLSPREYLQMARSGRK